MTGLRRALVSVAFAGVIVGAAAAALIASSDHISRPGLSIVIGLVICWSFIGTGLYAWWRRPTNRFGGYSGFMKSKRQPASHSERWLPWAGMPPASLSIRATCMRFHVMNVVLRLVKSFCGPPEPSSR